MEISKTYENYPVKTVLLSNLVSFGIYAAGFFIMLKTGLIVAFFYAVYILAMEFRLLRYHCTNCYYWGKTCGFGQGRLSALLFRRGNPADFCKNNFGWKDLIPDMLVSLVPFITGIVVLIIRFNWIVLAALILILWLTTSGNGYIRGSLTCKYCKQREIGCPAELLFNKPG